ncbi:hypothetical protein ACR3LR_08525 [Pantoea eucalypti]|uniref:hypothetical protein n=1 Tax=Pantoea eucalypti TaxID=470933 RepID=UPI003EE75BAF
MASVIEICNIALSRLGNSRTINTLSEKSKEAGLCDLHYDSARLEVLADFDWNFAIKRVALADTSSAPSDWQYAYRYPTDCQRIVDILVPGMRNPPERCRIEYQIGASSDGTGKLIFTDQENAWLRYVCDIKDPNMFDPLFRSALSWKLASEVGMSLSSAPNLVQNCLTMYSQTIRSAGSRSLNESQEPVEPQSEFTSARLS